MKEFWTDIATKASWEKLIEISKEFNFVLIGGWAAYLWTNRQKSKDIDVIVNHSNLIYLRQNYDLSKNNFLKKYEIKLDKFDIDIYVPGFSKLTIPEEDILKKYNTKIKGIKTIQLEALLVLKQAAEIERRGSPKGTKDKLDILNILFFGDVDWKKYISIIKKYNLEGYVDELFYLLKHTSNSDIEYIGINFKEFKDFQKNILKKIKKL